MTVSVECYVLSALLQKRCPKLLAALEAMDQSVYDISNRWFSHLFCGSLPAETTVRIWDCLMYEGPKVLFRVALALLKVASTFPPLEFEGILLPPCGEQRYCLPLSCERIEACFRLAA